MKRIKMLNNISYLILGILLASCGSSELTKVISAEERFEIGKSKFDDEDYLEAITEFEIVKLQFPGSAVADDAQYYLAESRFKKEEYLLAGEEYQELRRNFPASPLVPLAQYKIGLCYYSLAPRSSLDQQYTHRAIDEFQAFLEYYSSHELAADASAKIKELNTKLAKKLFDTAELYMIMEYFKSATLYYNNVIEKFHDTQYAEPALLGKVKSLVSRKKYSEARQELNKYFDKYPDSNLMKEAASLRSTIDDLLKASAIRVNTHPHLQSL
ncbi:MAG: outer membrane protein assembly factor BamD [Ignavibacteriales bacterium]|nr:outer membrane protein assembly factor BamD [Ignavibacteriales bacterium]